MRRSPWKFAISSFLLLTFVHDAISEDCPPYLGESIEDKQACSLASHEYLSGSWKKRAGRCQVDEEDALGELAYPFTWICHDNEWGESCAADAKVSGCQDRIGAIADWYWQPDTCNLRKFNAAEFDRLLANKTLLVVGDSLGAQQYESLKMLLKPVITGYTVDPDLTGKRAWQKGPLYRKQEEGFQLRSRGAITFAHHLYLVGNEHATFWDQTNTSFEHVQWSIKARDADFVVFNTGHHWHKLDAQFVQYTEMVDRVLEHIAKSQRCPFFLFRTTNIGHVVPDEFREPLAGEEDYKPGLHPHYDLWRQIQRKEEVWVPLIKRHGLSHRVKVLNVSFTDVRGDAHVNKRLVALDQLEDFQPTDLREAYTDQLHYCLPGVPDYWNWLVFHAVATISDKLAEFVDL